MSHEKQKLHCHACKSEIPDPPEDAPHAEQFTLVQVEWGSAVLCLSCNAKCYEKALLIYRISAENLIKKGA